MLVNGTPVFLYVCRKRKLKKLERTNESVSKLRRFERGEIMLKRLFAFLRQKRKSEGGGGKEEEEEAKRTLKHRVRVAD